MHTPVRHFVKEDHEEGECFDVDVTYQCTMLYRAITQYLCIVMHTLMRIDKQPLVPVYAHVRFVAKIRALAGCRGTSDLTVGSENTILWYSRSTITPVTAGG